ncbi:C-type natriuretic peptide 2-like [Spinachia spinachia]
MAASSSSSFIPLLQLLLLLLLLTVAVEAKHLSQRDNRQNLQSLFGSRLSSLILASSTFDDITEGSAGRPTSSPSSASTGLVVSRGTMSGLASSVQEALPRLMLDLLRQQSKTTRRRSRKSMVGGGRGCFGMKMDRIGSISGLGC